MWSHLERGSSPVDWCESNYSISPVIAEFVNTVSNILFFLLPPVLIHLFQEYARFVNPAINVLWVLLMIVGISSAYFHATLSLVGQLLDELAILWVFMAAFAMFLPKRYFPKFFGGNRNQRYKKFLIYSLATVSQNVIQIFCHAIFQTIATIIGVKRVLMRPFFMQNTGSGPYCSLAISFYKKIFNRIISGGAQTWRMFIISGRQYCNVMLKSESETLHYRRLLALVCSVFSVLSTGFLVMHPAANAFALMTLAFPAVGFLYSEMGRVKCARVYRLGLRCVAVCLLAVFCWVMDRLFCDAWLSIDFPYMHGVWHILIFIASYTALVLFAYFNVLEERPEQKPQLKYWPRNDFELGIPYITIKHPCKKDSDLAI